MSRGMGKDGSSDEGRDTGGGMHSAPIRAAAHGQFRRYGGKPLNSSTNLRHTAKICTAGGLCGTIHESSRIIEQSCVFSVRSVTRICRRHPRCLNPLVDTGTDSSDGGGTMRGPPGCLWPPPAGRKQTTKPRSRGKRGFGLRRPQSDHSAPVAADQKTRTQETTERQKAARLRNRSEGNVVDAAAIARA